MKNNQNDLIFSIVFGVLALVIAGIAYGTKPEPPTIPAPPTINVAEAQLPATAVVYGNALPGAATTAGGTAGGGVGGPGSSFPGGPPGFPGGPSGSYPGGPPGFPGGPGGRGGPSSMGAGR